MGFVCHHLIMVTYLLNLPLDKDRDEAIFQATRLKRTTRRFSMERLVVDIVLINRLLNPRDLVMRISLTIVNY